MKQNCHDLVIVEAGLWVFVVVILFPLILYMVEFSLIKGFKKNPFPKVLRFMKRIIW